MLKSTLRRFDVRRRRRWEALVAGGRCPDCRQRVEDPANNRCNMPLVGRFGYHGPLTPLFKQPHPRVAELVAEDWRSS
jgi:hypothetical protein